MTGDSRATLPDAESSVQFIGDRPQAFFNALLTEHFVLQSVRGVTVSEATSRASLYLTTLSSALVAFGFLARTAFAIPFLAAVLPAVVLLGVFTYERLVETALEDVVALRGIQRIRAYYATLLPGAESYFEVPDPDRAPNELLDIGQRSSWRGVFFTVSSAVAAVNSIVAGAGVGFAMELTAHSVAGAVAGASGAAVVFALTHAAYQERRYRRVRTAPRR